MFHEWMKAYKLQSSLGGICISATVLALSGCAMGVAPVSSARIALSTQTGHAMGGQQPVSGAIVTLWKAGTTGYGQGATSLYTTSTDASGGFNLTGKYSCASGDMLYMTAYGGSSNVGTGSNSALGLMAALGECTAVQATPSVYVNEATTIASIFALQQFASVPYGTSGLNALTGSSVPLNIGAPTSNYVGLVNAFATTNHLSGATVNAIPTSYSLTATINSTPALVTATPPYLTIATLANILASCVNTQDGTSSVSTACNNLFLYAKPSSQSLAPADTIEVALDMAINPTNVGGTSSGLYGMSTPSAPFQPALTALPYSWALQIQYTSNSLVDATYPAYLLYNIYGLQIDSAGNIYILNDGAGSATTAPYENSVAEFSPTGVPLAIYLNKTGALSNPRSFVLDVNNNIWVSNYFGGNVTEYVSSTQTNNYTGLGTLKSMAADTAGNVFTTNTAGKILKLTPGTAAASTVATLANATAVPNYIAFDNNQNLWVSAAESTSATNGDQYVSYIPCTPGVGSNCTSSTTNTYGTPVNFQTNFPPLNSLTGTPTGIAIDSSNNAFIGVSTYAGTGGYGCEMILTSTTVATSAVPPCSTNNAAGVNLPAQAEIDGSGTLWVTNLKDSQAGYPVSVLTYSAGTFTPITSVHGFGLAPVQPAFMQIDQSGNVWQVGENATYTINELVGMASPAVAPLALAVKNGSLGKKP